MTFNPTEYPALLNLLTADYADDELTVDELYKLIADAREELNIE